MRIVQLRRHRLFNIVIGGILVLIIFYMIVSFFSDNQVHNIKVYWSEQLSRKQVSVRYLYICTYLYDHMNYQMNIELFVGSRTGRRFR